MDRIVFDEFSILRILVLILWRLLNDNQSSAAGYLALRVYYSVLYFLTLPASTDLINALILASVI